MLTPTFQVIIKLTVDLALLAADGGAIPFNTQFFHDDYDDGPGFDDVYEGDGDAASAPPGATSQEDQDLLAATQGQGRRIRPEFVNYAKRAKRVDVRKLKENIWKGLNIVVRDPLKDNEDESIVSRSRLLAVPFKKHDP
jgi:condensin complex subunit 2